jgi:hypothetical protein
MSLPSNPPGLRLYARFGDGAEYTDVGGFIELTDELTNLNIREIWRNGQYGVGADGYEGWNYISLYYGTDVETPVQDYPDELIEYTNARLANYYAKRQADADSEDAKTDAGAGI